MLDSRPGFAASIPLGGNYAQPSVTMEALPEGNSLDQAMNWAGMRQLSGAPIYDTNMREHTEIIRILGVDVSGGTIGAKRGGSADTSGALAALVRMASDYFTRYASATGSTRQLAPVETQVYFSSIA
ncbi:MAG: hypothetical protein ACKVS9_15880 [Phycisphaerae bacterium]